MYEKYITALQLMDAAVATKSAIKPEAGWGETEGVRNHHPCVFAWDACFDFVFANFAKPQTAADSGSVRVDIRHLEVSLVRPLIDGTYETRGQQIEEVLRSIPPKLAEEIFPVGVGRYLLRDAALPFDHRKSRTFSQFHNWYGSMILSY
jgi:hypothetical protein